MATSDTKRPGRENVESRTPNKLPDAAAAAAAASAASADGCDIGELTDHFVVFDKRAASSISQSRDLR